MIGTLSPLFTILLAVMILGEPFTLMNALGTALVLVGIGYYTWADMRSRTPAGRDLIRRTCRAASPCASP